MRRLVRVLFASIILLPTALVGQNKASVTADSLQATQTPDDRNEIRQIQELHNRAYSALRAEQERSRQLLCPKALTTVDVNQCLGQEFGTNQRNYRAEIAALSALVGGPRGPDGGSAAATPFNEAEATWNTYREQACNAFAGPPQNAGTIRPSLYENCLITLTRSHMNALGDLYTRVGMH